MALSESGHLAVGAHARGTFRKVCWYRGVSVKFLHCQSALVPRKYVLLPLGLGLAIEAEKRPCKTPNTGG